MNNDFEKQLELATLRLANYSEDAVKATIFRVAELVIKRTPVDTGRARGNWQSTIGTPTSAPTLKKDKAGTTTVVRAQNVINSLEMGQTFFLTNNLPYIYVLEYGGYPLNPKKGQKTVGGYSKLAPQGMLRVSLSEIARALR